MDKMREEFEAWFQSDIDAGPVVEDLCWQAWQASRAAPVVELPATCNRALIYGDGSMDHDEYFEVDDIKDALTAAGISYE